MMGITPKQNMIGGNDAMSKSLKKRELTIPKHRHCGYCGLPVKATENFCSKECEDEFEKISKRRKYFLFLAVTPTIIIIILVLASYILRS